ncbi:MAG: TIGR03621 family F420-dependent LLM class oxidoreductase [Acidimicrobiales bacterium]
MRPFRFAAQVQSAETPDAWRELARRTEASGYSTLYMPDHLGDQWGPLVALTAAAEATTELNVGSLVFDNDYRHPVFLAKEIATLDLLSGGRVEFGLGAGWMRSDYDQSGLAMDSPGVRIERMVEGLHIMKALWRDGSCDFSGDHYKVTAAPGQPRPHSTPQPKIVIGGGGRRVLTIAGREADIVGFNAKLSSGEIGPAAAATAVASEFHRRVDWVREAAADRFESLELQCMAIMSMVVPNRSEVVEMLAPAFGLDASVVNDIPIVLIGTVDEICEALVRRRDEFGFSYWVVSGDAATVEAFAPVVARLAGT